MEKTVVQEPFPGECARRVRFEQSVTPEQVHVIIEEEDHSGDGLFADERGHVTVDKATLIGVVINL